MERVYMLCSLCNIRKAHTRGYCNRCYEQGRLNGSIPRLYVINSGKCSIENCPNKSFSKNLCQYHYGKAQHPLKSMWALLRSGYPKQYPTEWNDFSIFISQVGEKPYEKSQLRRIDPSKHYSISNVYWTTPVFTQNGNYTNEEARNLEREWRYRKYFGITLSDFNQMLKNQNGVCAICSNPETKKSSKSDRIRELNVDHDHKTGKTRGLLCSECNSGLGRFKDSIEILGKAINYLKKHQKPKVQRFIAEEQA
jgi:Recombination endonuclease VII